MLLSNRHSGLLIFIKEDVSSKVHIGVQLIVRPEGWEAPTAANAGPVTCAGAWVPQSAARDSEWCVLGPKADLPNKPESVIFARHFLGLAPQLLNRNLDANHHDSVVLPLQAHQFGRDPDVSAAHTRCFFVSTFKRNNDRLYTAAQVTVNAVPVVGGFTVDTPIDLSPSTPVVPVLNLPILAPYLVAPTAGDSAAITTFARQSCCASIGVLVTSHDFGYANWSLTHLRPPARSPHIDGLYRTFPSVCVWFVVGVPCAFVRCWIDVWLRGACLVAHCAAPRG